MIDLQALANGIGRSVELRFVDGHAVRAKLVSVDTDSSTEIIYDIEEIISVGPSEMEAVLPGAVAAARPETLGERVAIG